MAFKDWFKRSGVASKGVEVLPPQQSSGLVIPFGMDTRLDVTPRDTARKQVEAYSGWVYSAVGILSKDVEANEFGLWTPGEKQVELTPIFKQPNAFQNFSDFLATSIINLDLTGRCFWYLPTVGGQRGGTAVGIQNLATQYIGSHRLNKMGMLEWWEYSPPGRAMQLLPAEDVFMTRWPHPSNILEGASPVAAFASSYDMDLYARAYTATLLKNNANVPGLISVDQPIDQDQGDELRTAWIQRFSSGAGKEGPAVLGRGATYTQLSMSIKDMEFLSLAQLSMEQIFAIYGVPPTKAGLGKKGGTLAMSREDENTYSKNALLPRLTKVQNKLNEMMHRLDAGDVEFRFVSPVIKDKEAIHKRSLEDLKAGVITVNEHRATNDKLDDLGKEGDVYYLPTGVRIVSKIEEFDPFAGFSAFASDIMGSGDEEDEPEQNSKSKAVCKSALTDERIELSAMAFLKAQSARERTLISDTRRLFSREASLIISSLKKQDSLRKGAITKATGDEIVEGVLAETEAQWIEALKDSTFNSLRDGFGLLASDGVPSSLLLSWNIYRDEAAEFARKNAGLKIKYISRTTRDGVVPIISEGIESGATIAEMTDQISEVFNTYKSIRSEVIARTETATAVNQGKWEHTNEIEKEHHVSFLKTWNPVIGERTRRWHRTENIAPSATVPKANAWVVDNQPMMHPQDTRGRASNVIQCRCTTTFEVV